MENIIVGTNLSAETLLFELCNVWPACITATSIVHFSDSHSLLNTYESFLGEGRGEKISCIVSIVAWTTEESVWVLAGVKFFLQAIQMDWGPPSLLLCGYGKLSGRKLKLTTHLNQLLHSSIHFHGMNGNDFTLTIASICISHYCTWNILYLQCEIGGSYRRFVENSRFLGCGTEQTQAAACKIVTI